MAMTLVHVPWLGGVPLAAPLAVSCTLLAALFTWRTIVRSRSSSDLRLDRTAENVQADVSSPSEGLDSEPGGGAAVEVLEQRHGRPPVKKHAKTEHLEDTHRHHHHHHRHHEHSHHQESSGASSSSDSGPSKHAGKRRATEASRTSSTSHHHHGHHSHTHDSRSPHRHNHPQHGSLDHSDREHESKILPFDATHDEPDTMGHFVESSENLKKNNTYDAHASRSSSPPHQHRTHHHHLTTGQDGGHVHQIDAHGHGSNMAQRVQTMPQMSRRRSESPVSPSTISADAFRDLLRKNVEAYLNAHPFKNGDGHDKEGHSLVSDRDAGNTSNYEAGDMLIGHGDHDGKPPPWAVEGGPGWHHRQRARTENHHRHLAHSRAIEAYKRNNRREGHQFSAEAQMHEANQRRYNALAAAEIFNCANPRYGMDRLQRCDLHGLFVDEAVQYAQDHLVRCREAMIGKTILVVGKGSHSSSGSARIRPAILAMLSSTGGIVHGVHQNNEGMIVVEFAVARH